MEIIVKQLKLNENVIFPQTSAEAVVAKSLGEVITLDKFITKAVVINNVTNNIATITNNSGTVVYPKTTAKAVVINDTNLEDYLNDKLTLDERPTENSKNGVTSGGVYSELKDTVGEIYTNLKQI